MVACSRQVSAKVPEVRRHFTHELDKVAGALEGSESCVCSYIGCDGLSVDVKL